MARHYVCLCFDFDAMSLWIARDMTTPTPISRGEFGVVGADRILRLLAQHRIRATWFTPGHTLETYPEISRRIHAEGHELAAHGYAHEPPATLSAEREEAILLRSREVIRGITGAAPRGYRSPSWDLSAHTVGLLARHGFLYDSSLMGDDYTPYWARSGDAIPRERAATLGERTSLVEICPSWSLDDFPAFEYLRMPTYLQQGLRRAGDVLENWVDDFEYMRRTLDWGVVPYTFHPQVTGRGHRMMLLQRLIVELAARGATFARMDEVAAEFAGRA